MFTERTSVGLDVHARSVAAAAIDGVTGEIFQARLSPAFDDVRAWVAGLPGPCAVAWATDPFTLCVDHNQRVHGDGRHAPAIEADARRLATRFQHLHPMTAAEALSPTPPTDDALDDWVERFQRRKEEAS